MSNPTGPDFDTIMYLLNIASAAEVVVKAVKESDAYYGHGDRVSREDKALESLEKALNIYEENKCTQYT